MTKYKVTGVIEFLNLLSCNVSKKWLENQLKTTMNWSFSQDTHLYIGPSMMDDLFSKQCLKQDSQASTSVRKCIE